MPLFLRLLKHKRGAWISFVSIYSLGLSVFLVVNGLAKNFQAEIKSKSKELLEADLRVHARRPFTESEERILQRLIPAKAARAETWGFLSMLRVGPEKPTAAVDSSGKPAAGGGEPAGVGHRDSSEVGRRTSGAGRGDSGNVPATGNEMVTPGAAASQASPGASRLVQVKAISPGYPLVGGFTFAGAPDGWSGRLEEFRSGEMLAPRELLAGLKLKVGDTVSLGGKSFVIKDEYKTRPGGNFDFWEMGSRVYIPLGDMPATGLERKGSRIFRYRFFMLPADIDVEALRDSLEEVISDPEVDVAVYTESGSDLGRSFNMVTAFLKMLSLSAFLLSAVGAAFFFRHHLVGERKTVAVLTTLGAPRRRIVGIYVAQNLFLSSLAALVGMALARVWSVGLPILIRRLYAIDIPAALPLSTFFIGLGLAVCTSLLFGVTGFAGLGRIPPATLIKPLETAPLGWPARAGLFLLQGAFFFALAFADSRSWLLSALSVGAMGGAFLLLAVMGWAAFKVFWMLRSHLGYSLRIVLGSIRLGREKSLLAFAALGFVAFTSCLVPQLQDLILNEIRVPQGRVIPQLFLFDIQEEQLEDLQALIGARGEALAQTSPMVRARLEKVNGAVFKRDEDERGEDKGDEDKGNEDRGGGRKGGGEGRGEYKKDGASVDSAAQSRRPLFAPLARLRAAAAAMTGSRRGHKRAATLEQRNRQQFRNRGFNLSYRDTLSDAETLVAGTFWKGPVAEGALPEISMEKEFAKRLRLKLGDTLAFDVQGVEVQGRITSLRKVRWASFQPNFFVLFQPGALDEAPKTFLGTVKQIPPEAAEDIQNRVSEAFPNVTLMNLKDVIGRMVETLGKLTWLVRFLSGFALLIGLAILWLVVDALVAENQRTIQLLRALGEPRSRLARMFLAHYAGFCLTAGLTGYFLSLAAAYLINLAVWQVPWIPSPWIFFVCAGASLAVGAACSLYAAYRGAGRPLRELLSLSR
jgi:predicted lysophospholipase L1 biosynthesis ABC-type transport system permease subunit